MLNLIQLVKFHRDLLQWHNILFDFVYYSMLTLALNLLVGPQLRSCWHPNFASRRLHDRYRRRQLHLSANRFFSLISDSAPSTSDVSEPSTILIWCHPPATWCHPSVSLWHTASLAKSRNNHSHGLNETLCRPWAGEGRARGALVSDVKHWKCSILGGRPW